MTAFWRTTLRTKMDMLTKDEIEVRFREITSRSDFDDLALIEGLLFVEPDEG